MEHIEFKIKTTQELKNYSIEDLVSYTEYLSKILEQSVNRINDLEVNIDKIKNALINYAKS